MFEEEYSLLEVDSVCSTDRLLTEDELSWIIELSTSEDRNTETIEDELSKSLLFRKDDSDDMSS